MIRVVQLSRYVAQHRCLKEGYGWWRHAQVSVSVAEAAPIMSMALSPDGAHILVNLASHTIHLWPLAPLLRQLDALHAGHVAPGQHCHQPTLHT